jgi:hypothetical protein
MTRALVATTSLTIVCCVSVARISDLPASLDEVTFGTPQFTDRWEDEYEFGLPGVTDEEFFAATRPALGSNGFRIVRFEPEKGVVTAERGMRGDEWASVVGVYRQRGIDGGAVKILFKVTQDFTGSFVHRRYAENIADRIRQYLVWHSSGEVPFGEEHP